MNPMDSGTITVQQGGASVRPEAKGRQYQRIIEQAKGLQPLRTAVVHLVDAPSLSGAIEAARARLILPVMVGPRRRGGGRADQARFDPLRTRSG